MKNYSAKEIKNIVLIGAPGTGKTTLAEAMAFEGKVIDRRGSIEANNTLSDNTDIEHEYKRSIYSTILFTEFMERKLNIIDCPGSDDFCGSLFSAFKVADVGVMVFNAQNGWEVGSEIQARYARVLNKPLIAFVNQLDSDKASFDATLESIRAASRVKPVVVQYPVNPGPGFDAFIDVLLMKMYRFKDENGTREELDIPAEEAEKAQALNKELVEAAAEYDDALMELYFEKGTLTQDDIRQLQMAKGAIASGIELMAAQLGGGVETIERVLLAGAFGSFIRPESDCRIGLLPPQLLDRIQAIGNAAGSGARRVACSGAELQRAQTIADRAEFLELAALPEFQRTFAKSMRFCP